MCVMIHVLNDLVLASFEVDRSNSMRRNHMHIYICVLSDLPVDWLVSCIQSDKICLSELALSVLTLDR